MIQYTPRSEFELLEEEVNGCLLIVASVWVVVSKRKTRKVKEKFCHVYLNSPIKIKLPTFR